MVNNITFKSDFTVTDNQKKKYIDYVTNKVKEDGGDPAAITEISLKNIPGDTDNVDVEYVTHQPKFERIRRITGYLVGAMDKWNDAKRAEEAERVKHSVSA